MSDTIDREIMRALEASERAASAIVVLTLEGSMGKAGRNRGWLVAASFAVIAVTGIVVGFLVLGGGDSIRTPSDEPSSSSLGAVSTTQVTSTTTEQLAGSGGPIVVMVSDRLGVEPGIDFVIVKNDSDDQIDLSGWSLRTRGSTASFLIPAGVTLDAGESIAIYETMTVGERCRQDTNRAFFTCNALGLDVTTREVIFPKGPVELLDASARVIATSDGS
jgi:hypothetical protein